MKHKVRIMPLGGMEEVGKNSTIIETNSTLILIDYGLKFPDYDLFGVNHVINDISYLKSNNDRFKALIITHAHLDHIGGIPYLLQFFDIPIYGTPFTIAMIKSLLTEHLITKPVRYVEITPGKEFTIGDIPINAIRVNHSIIDSVSYCFKTRVGHIIYTGDFKIDSSPLYENSTDLQSFARYGSEGVTVLLSDSTNAAATGYSLSESSLSSSFENIFLNAKGRTIVATFSSQINRIRHIIDMAKSVGKKVAFCGRSLINNIELTIGLNIIADDSETFVDIHNIDNIPDHKLIIITTGSQGEPESGLSLMAKGRHRFIKLRETDSIVFSSSNIPGNETSISRLINDLYKLGVKVITNNDMNIHATGHAKREELKFMISLVRPKFFVPLHGEYIMLSEHRFLAEASGVSPNNIFVLENGERLEVSEHGARIIDKIRMKPWYIEGNRNNALTTEVIQERQNLSEHGVLVVSVIPIGNKFQIHLSSRGFVNRQAHEDLFQEIEHIVAIFFSEREISSDEREGDYLTPLKKRLRTFIKEKTAKEPILIIHA